MFATSGGSGVPPDFRNHHHSMLVEMLEAKEALSLSLVALFGGARPTVSLAEVKAQMVDVEHIDADAFLVS